MSGVTETSCHAHAKAARPLDLPRQRACRFYYRHLFVLYSLLLLLLGGSSSSSGGSSVGCHRLTVP